MVNVIKNDDVLLYLILTFLVSKVLFLFLHLKSIVLHLSNTLSIIDENCK